MIDYTLFLEKARQAAKAAAEGFSETLAPLGIDVKENPDYEFDETDGNVCVYEDGSVFEKQIGFAIHYPNTYATVREEMIDDFDTDDDIVNHVEASVAENVAWCVAQGLLEYIHDLYGADGEFAASLKKRFRDDFEVIALLGGETDDTEAAEDFARAWGERRSVALCPDPLSKVLASLLPDEGMRATNIYIRNYEQLRADYRDKAEADLVLYNLKAMIEEDVHNRGMVAASYAARDASGRVALFNLHLVRFRRGKENRVNANFLYVPRKDYSLNK